MRSFLRSNKKDVGPGVAAALYTSATHAVVVFRGSYSDADFNNMLLWHEGWFLENMRTQILQRWEAVFGNSTTAGGLANAEIQRRTASDDFYDRAKFFAGTQALILKQDIDWLRSGLKNKWDLVEQGYWPLTKVEECVSRTGKHFS